MSMRMGVCENCKGYGPIRYVVVNHSGEEQSYCQHCAGDRWQIGLFDPADEGDGAAEATEGDEA